MTIQLCMAMVDTVLPNYVDKGVKCRWLGEIEGKVRVELLGQEPEDTSPFDNATSVDLELTVPHPYDQLYWLYVMAMIHFVTGETARYEQAAALFNAAYRDFAKWLKRRGGVL